MTAQIVTETHYPFLSNANEGLVSSIKGDPDMGHIAAIECAGAPKGRAVRWALAGDELILRGEGRAVPPTPWNLAIGAGRTQQVSLEPGQRLRFCVLAVPEISEPSPRKRRYPDKRVRGRRRPLLTAGEQMAWFEYRTMWVPGTGGSVPQCANAKILDISQCLMGSDRTGDVWRAVRAEIEAEVVDPGAVVQMMIGRYRTYGFGLPLFAMSG